VLVDVKSALYVSASEIDFQDKMIGGGFKIHNPNATATCSCGESFFGVAAFLIRGLQLLKRIDVGLFLSFH